MEIETCETNVTVLIAKVTILVHSTAHVLRINKFSISIEIRNQHYISTKTQVVVKTQRNQIE